VSGRVGGRERARRRFHTRERESVRRTRSRSSPVRAAAIFPNRCWPAISYNIPQAEQHNWSSGGEREARDREGRRRSGSGGGREGGYRHIWAAWWAGPGYCLLLLLSFSFFLFVFLKYLLL